MREVFEPTPLQRNAYLSSKYEAEIYLKREDLSPVRSYKNRGAYNAMRKAREVDESRSHFVCASAGNHAPTPWQPAKESFGWVACIGKDGRGQAPIALHDHSKPLGAGCAKHHAVHESLLRSSVLDCHRVLANGSQ